MPASTLPTRSAPTSAPLVKMPPPRRAKIEISEAPNESATSEFDHRAAFRREAARADQEPVVERDAEQRETGDQHAGDGARLERDIEAFGERLRGGLRGADVRAHRDVHADEAGRTGEHRTDQEADRHKCAEQDPQPDEDDRADDRDRHVLAFEIGLRAFGDRGGDLLHFL